MPPLDLRSDNMAREATLRVITKLDSGNFTQQLKNISEAIDDNAQEFKLATARAEALGDETAKLQAAQNYYAKAIDLQAQRQKVYNEALEVSKVKNGENSEVTKSLTKSVSNAEIQLHKYESGLRKTNDALSNTATAENKAGNEATEMGNDIKGADSKIGGIKNSLGKLPAILGAAAAALASLSQAFDFLKEGVQRASDLIEIQNVVNTTFGDSSKIIDDWAKSATKNFGISELMAKQFNGQMGSMLKSMGLTADETIEMSTKLAGLAGDFASFYNLGHDEAWEKIRSGISGETEPLKQLGINMNVANLDAYALQTGLNKVYNEMTQSEQAQLRYNYLLSVSSDAQGDFAKTSDSYANQQRLLKMQVDNLGASLGEILMPGLQKVGEAFGTTLEKMKPTLEKVTQTVSDKLFPVMASGIESLGEMAIAVAPILGDLAGTVGELAEALKIATPIIKAAVDVLKTLSDLTNGSKYGEAGFNLGAAAIGGDDAPKALKNIQELIKFYNSYAELEAELKKIMSSQKVSMLQATRILKEKNGLPKYGAGDIVTSPHMAVVGDEPEVIVPLNNNPRSRQLAEIAARKTGAATGGASYTQNVNITVNGDANPNKIARELQKISRELAMEILRF